MRQSTTLPHAEKGVEEGRQMVTNTDIRPHSRDPVAVSKMIPRLCAESNGVIRFDRSINFVCDVFETSFFQYQRLMKRLSFKY